MKAIILAAGIGRRLRRFGNNAKCLFEIQKKPLILHQIEKLYECGVKDVTVVTGYQARKVLQTVAFSASTYFNPVFRHTNSILSLWFVQRKITDSEDTIIINGDIFFSEETLKRLIDEKSYNITMVVDCNSKKDFMVLVEDGQIVNMGKEMKNPSGEYVGITKIPASRAKAFRNELNIAVEEEQMMIWYELICQKMIRKGEKVLPFYTRDNEYWFEIDTVEDYLRRKKHGNNENHGRA